MEELDLYNIGWIIAHSEESKLYLSRLPNIKPGPKYRELQFYTVDREHNYFVTGEGEVTQRTVTHLELKSLKGHEVILKYHYIPGLASTPPVTLAPVFLGSDPIPFIRLLSPPPEIVLSFGKK